MYIHRVNAVPRWSKLSHFSAIIAVKFADGTKFEDISVVCAFATVLLQFVYWESWLQIILPSCYSIMLDNQQGYILLKCIRRYNILDLYASLQTHTEETLHAYRAGLGRFSDAIKVIFHHYYIMIVNLKY